MQQRAQDDQHRDVDTQLPTEHDDLRPAVVDQQLADKAERDVAAERGCDRGDRKRVDATARESPDRSAYEPGRGPLQQRQQDGGREQWIDPVTGSRSHRQIDQDLREPLRDLNAGLGDIVAASLTITPARQEIVDFSAPGMRNVNEVSSRA